MRFPSSVVVAFVSVTIAAAAILARLHPLGTWATTLPLSMTKTNRFAGFINVRDLGACGNGICDDTRAIQVAVDQLCMPTNGHCRGNGGVVYLPGGTYRISAPIRLYSDIILEGDGISASKIVKVNNSLGTLGPVRAGSGMGRGPQSCGGGPCVDDFRVDAIVQVVYDATASTAYAYRWSIRDISLFGAGQKGTAFGIFSPRSAQFEIRNVYIYTNCPHGDPYECGALQSHGFYTRDSWMYHIANVTVDSAAFGFMHGDDGSHLGSGTTAAYDNVWAVNVGYAGFFFYGLTTGSLRAISVDHYNVPKADLSKTAEIFAAYTFSSCNGIIMSGVDLEDIGGQILFASASHGLEVSGLRSLRQTGFRSKKTAATLFLDAGTTVDLSGSSFDKISSPAAFHNIVLQGGSVLYSRNSILPYGGNSFTSYQAGSAKIEENATGISFTSANGRRKLLSAPIKE